MDKRKEVQFFDEGPSRPLSRDEWAARNEPYANQQRLHDLLDEWERHGAEVLAQFGYSIPETPTGYFSYPIDAISEPAARDARGVVEGVKEVRRLLPQNDKNALVFAAIMLGHAASRAHSRPFEPLATTGKNVRDGGSKGRLERDRKASEHDIIMALNQASEQHPAWGITALRVHVAKSLQISEKQLRNITLHNPKK